MDSSSLTPISCGLHQRGEVKLQLLEYVKKTAKIVYKRDFYDHARCSPFFAHLMPFSRWLKKRQRQRSKKNNGMKESNTQNTTEPCRAARKNDDENKRRAKSNTIFI